MKMIALVSDQRMQNVIPILQDGARYSELLLVLSKERRTGQPLPRFVASADDLKAALPKSIQVTLCHEWVGPSSIEETEATVSLLIRQACGQDDVCVNITGGTKPMAIGALRAAQAAGVTSLYTNTEDNEIIWLASDGAIRAERIQVRNLDVKLYIRAYGGKVLKSQPMAKVGNERKLWSETIATHHEIIYTSVICQVMKAISDSRNAYPVRCKFTGPLDPRQIAVIQQLAEQGLWEWDEIEKQITVTTQSYGSLINGGWVEVYVATRMEQSGCFDDILLNVLLKGIAGEIDVAAIKNGKLVLVECKSNLKQIVQLNTLDGFRRRLGGSFAHAYYARGSDDNQSEIQEQCKKLGLNGVFFGPQMREIGVKICEQM
jgi:hypothetical protein